MNPIPLTRTHRTTLVLLTVAAFALRLGYLARPIYTDEAYTYLYFIQDGLGDVLTDYREPNNHIFQTIFAWASVALWGNHPAGMRIPALISGILLIPAVFEATRRLYSPTAGLFAAALVTVSVPLAEYAVSARGYSFIALFFALHVILAQHLKTQSSLWRWVAYGMVAAFGLYTVPIMVYPLGAVSLWLLVSIWVENSGRLRWTLTRDMLITLTLAALLTLALYTPIILSNGVGALVDNPFVQPLSAAEFRATITGFPAAFVAFVGQGIPDIAVYGLLLMVAISLFAHRRISQNRVPLLLPTVVWLGLLVVVQYVLPPIRTWIFIVVLYAMLAGAGMDALLQRLPIQAAWMSPLVAFGIVGVLGASLLYTDALNRTLTYEREEDARETAAFLAERLQPGDRILLTNGAIHNYEYYLDAHDQPWDIIALTFPQDVVEATLSDHTLYVLTTVGDQYVTDRLRESVGVDLDADDVRLEPLATMPGGEIVVNRLVIGDA